jgi:hypothetical protein
VQALPSPSDGSGAVMRLTGVRLQPDTQEGMALLLKQHCAPLERSALEEPYPLPPAIDIAFSRLSRALR